MQILFAVEEGTTDAPAINEFAQADDSVVEVETVADRVLSRFERDDAPDLLLLDFNFPGLSGMEGIRTALDFLGDRPLGVLVHDVTSVDAENAFVAGASAILPLNLSPEAFGAAVMLLQSGVTFAIIDHDQACGRLSAMSKLSHREIEVLKGVCNGLQNKEIAHVLGIQEVTVKMHVRAVINKLGARNRTHAAMLARDLGVV
jgi:two-component system, NarL family, nitrate/nitrite response regulator NarL